MKKRLRESTPDCKGFVAKTPTVTVSDALIKRE